MSFVLQLFRPVKDFVDGLGCLVPLLVAISVENVVIVAWNQNSID